jgi:hypothetical protein
MSDEKVYTAADLAKAVKDERDACARLAQTVQATNLTQACKAHYDGSTHCSQKRAEAIYRAILARG